MSGTRSGAGPRLARELVAWLGEGAELETLSSQGWTSITFSGERHQMRIALRGAEAVARGQALGAQADSLELDLPGHLLVDVELADEQRAEDGTVRLDLRAVTLHGS